MAKHTEQKSTRIAIVGATSLRGKELKELLATSRLATGNLALLDDDEALGQLTEYAGEPTFVQGIETETFQPGQVVFFASTNPDFTRQHWQKAAAADCVLVDLSHALLDVEGAVVRVAFLPREKGSASRRWLVSPHPGVLILLAILLPFHRRFGLTRAVAHVFEPVSERGAAGIEELQRQTVNLLSFQEAPRAVYDSQVAFNLLAEYGERSRAPLHEVEAIVARELGCCSADLAARTALRLLQPPVFHGVGVSIWAEFDQVPAPATIEEMFSGSWVQVRSQQEGVPAVSDAAGRNDILLARVMPDRTHPGAFWFWAVADNLRLAVRNAVALAEDIVA